MTSRTELLEAIHCMDDEMEKLIGRKVFGHIAAPTPTTERITFGDGHVCLSLTEAHEYLLSLVVTARHDPSKLPWPLSEPLPV